MTTGKGKRPAKEDLWWAALTAALALVAGPARATQPGGAPADPGEPAAAEDPDAAKARQLFEQGVAAMKEQQWARAETLFEQAYELKRHYQIAGNLGTCELELGKHAEAATHLHAALTELGDDPGHEPERLELKRLLTTARAQCSTLELRVEPAGETGLEVTVDGRRLSWPERLVFVPPGKHEITARQLATSREASARLETEAGVTRKVALELGEGSSAPPPPSTGDEAGSELPSYPVWIGIGATVAAAGAGIALRIVGAGAESDADQLRDDLRAGQTSCPADCPELIDRYGDADGAYDASTGLLIAAGALAAATVGYAVLVWTDDGDEPAQSARLTVHPQGGGLGLTLHFQ